MDGHESVQYDGAVIPRVPLFADVGIPMIVLTLPGMIALLLPVILIETWFIAKRTSNPVGQVFRAAAAANVTSTLLGVPLAWLVSFAFQTLMALGLLGLVKVIPRLGEGNSLNSSAAYVVGTIISAAWIPGEPPWTVPLAALILLVPSFFASVWIERKIMRRSLLLDKAVVRDANLLSYAFLCAGSLAWVLIRS